MAVGLLGWWHALPTEGTDILPAMGASDLGSTGFTGPLPAGHYSIRIEDDLPSNYDFSFQIGVPEHSTWAMMLLGFAGLGFAGCRS